MRIRRFISLTMVFAFVAMVYTGVMLFVTPQGRVAYWTGWRLLGLSKDQYGALHTTFMVVFITAGVWHLVLNWKAIKNYLRNRSREMRVFTREFNVALLLTIAFAWGTLAGVPPWSSLLTMGDSVKGYWERRDGSPPWGHAEETTLVRFTRGLADWERLEHGQNVRIPVDGALASLRRAGMAVEDEHQRIIDIAEANNTTPQVLMAIIRLAEEPLPASEGASDAVAASIHDPSDGPLPMPYSGLGRMKLGDYCARYGLDVATVLGLFPAGYEADPDRTVRQIAEELETDPAGLIDLLNANARGPR